MIRIELGAEVDRRGVFEYSAPGYPLCKGVSRQPLLDACRQLKSTYGLTASRAGLFREGREVADLTCDLEDGAATTVREATTRFVKYRRFEAFQPLVRRDGRDAMRARAS
jgi:hypothetical protein